MRLVNALFLLTFGVFAQPDTEVTVCREDKYDQCECITRLDIDRVPYLNIYCSFWDDLNTTNIVIPRKIFNTFDIKYIRAEFDYLKYLHHIRSPSINSQLAGKMEKLIFKGDQIHQIEQIDEKAFDNLPQLNQLGFIESGLKSSTISSGWLTSELNKSLRSLMLDTNFLYDKLENLEKLYLSFNLIRKISNQAFTNLYSLNILGLDDNELTEIPSISFANLRNLTELSLSGNLISRVLPTDFDNIRHLFYLDLSYNYLTEIPTLALSQVSGLTYLNLGGNRIKTVPNNTFANLPNLIELRLHKNHFRKIPSASFADLPNLTDLDMGLNQITEIPLNAFNHVRNLDMLWLGSNPLKKIHVNAFSRLSRLTFIDLSETTLTRIPIEALERLKSLKKLWFGTNNITEIPTNSLYRIGQLTWLNFEKSQIKRISSYAFAGLGNLTRLNLRANQIKYIEKNAFDDLVELSVLDLSQNPNLKFSDEAFGSEALINLETLKISECNLDNLPVNLFQGLPNLWILDVSFNNFTFIPMAIRNINRLFSLNLLHNPIDQIKPYTFNNSKIHDLVFDRMSALTIIDDCAFCGMTVYSISIAINHKLKTIHDNAFGFANNTPDKTRKFKSVTIYKSAIETLGKTLLPWKKLEYIDIKHNPANCNSSMDWLFRDNNLTWAPGREDRCSNFRFKLNLVNLIIDRILGEKLPDCNPSQSTTPITYPSYQSTKQPETRSFSDSRISFDIIDSTIFYLFVCYIF